MTTTRMDPDARKAQLLDAAYAVAAKNGYKSITRELVAAEAGVSAGLVTRYFENMVALTDEIVAKAVKDRHVGLIAEAMADNHKRTRKLRKDPAVKKAVTVHLFGA